MRETAFAFPDSERVRLAARHERVDGNLLEKPNAQSGSAYVRGDHGLKSTAGDYVKFLQMLLKVAAGDTSQLIQPQTFALMAQNQIGPLDLVQDQGAMNHRSRPLPSGGGRDKFGLGFQISVMEAENLRPRGCLSWSGIANTFFWIDCQNRLAAILLMQVDPYGDEACISALFGFEQAIYRHLDS